MFSQAQSDVFLTPLKPREKVVSAEDVQSSLYFLHIDIPEDKTFQPPEEAPEQDVPSPSAITRKPLPTPPVSPAEGSPRQRSSAFDDKPHLGVPQRKPVSSGSSSRQSLDLPDIPPRPPMRSPPTQSSQFGLDDRAELRPYLARRPLSNQFLDPQVVSGRPSMDSRSSYISGGTGRSSEAPSSHEEDEACVSLTLIRRDPTSGFQWNVAKIRDPPVHEVSSEVGNNDSIRTKKSGAPLFLDIHNPGYTKFIQFDQTRPTSSGSADMPPLSPNLSSSQDGVFRRRLWMDGSRFADHSYGHRKTPSWSGEQQNQRPSIQLNRQSLQAAPRAVVDRRSKGYSFRSPWGGRCEFSTGAAGRSLKVASSKSLANEMFTNVLQCKHVLDNPLSSSVEVSELRFNLPTGSSSRTPALSDSKRSSYISRPGLHRHTTSDELNFGGSRKSVDMANFLDEHGNIDLSLGKERAGGGFQGKQAKLGKLIIDDEGVKMLDLIVAANLALWWRAYERT